MRYGRVLPYSLVFFSFAALYRLAADKRAYISRVSARARWGWAWGVSTKTTSEKISRPVEDHDDCERHYGQNMQSGRTLNVV